MALRVRRVVTGHDKDGRAVATIDEVSQNLRSARPGATACVVWTSQGFPVDNTGAADEGLRESGTTLDNGTVFRILELQPDNITYKRQAYSALAVSRSGGTDADGRTRFRQAPQEGEDWPFVSDFNKDMVRFEPELAARLKLPGAAI